VGPKNLGLLWLVIFAIAMSAVSLYYYLQVLKEIYVAEPPAGAPLIRATAPFMVAVVLIALGVVALGCAPDLLVGKLSAAIQSAGF
jgi:NADH-quinone oxidoreductase subunit N